MKTIAQQLNITEFPFIIKNKKGNDLYYEDSDGICWKKEFDEKGNQTYLEISNGYWEKSEYDENNYTLYYENSNGYIFNKRPKTTPEYTMEQLIEKLGEDFKLIK